MTTATVPEKFCTGCEKIKYIIAFHRNKRTKDGHEAHCKRCRKVHTARWRKTYRPRQRKNQAVWYKTRAGQERAYQSAQKTGIKKELIRRAEQHPPYVPARVISLDEYEQMLEAQDGGCAICHAPPTAKRLSLDHCHVTGKIRGLLCAQCNHGLGNFRDSPNQLETARNYLILHGK